MNYKQTLSVLFYSVLCRTMCARRGQAFFSFEIIFLLELDHCAVVMLILFFEQNRFDEVTPNSKYALD